VYSEKMSTLNENTRGTWGIREYVVYSDKMSTLNEDT
jgi:hypothetical protein